MNPYARVAGVTIHDTLQSYPTYADSLRFQSIKKNVIEDILQITSWSELTLMWQVLFLRHSARVLKAACMSNRLDDRGMR